MSGEQLELGAAEALADEDARARIAGELDATLFVEAGAGSGKTRSLVERVVALVASGVELRHIAAITFTEKAAGELRDRIRRALEDRARDQAADAATRRRCAASADQVDAAAISTLHAFAQRILSENPIEAALPPGVEVLDEVASEIEFDDRWRRFRDALLDDDGLERCLLLAFATGIRVADLRMLARIFDANWDLVADPARIPWTDTEPPPLDATELCEAIDAVLARRAECADATDKLCAYITDDIAPYAERLRDAGDELELLRLLRTAPPTFRPGKKGRGDNWPDKDAVLADIRALAEARTALVEEVAYACVRRLAAEVASFTLEAAEARRARGRLEFHDLLVGARELLRGERGVAVRGRLSRRYQRLLLDEFQDTDPIQIELACLIASDEEDAGAKAWCDIPVTPGRLFFVGDPKQSIYRFRRADIALFLAARDTFGERVHLTTNFRATPPLVDWINRVFGRLITYADASQPEYQPIAPAPFRGVPPAGPAVAVLGAAEHEAGISADALREREARDVADAVLAASAWQVSDDDGAGGETWRPATRGDITILLPARTSLAALERELDARDIAYRAETSSLVYATREIRELLATARVVADPTDELALATALRSPVFGCGDDDLVDYRLVHDGSWSLFAGPPDALGDDHPVVAALAFLRELHRDSPWLAPAEVLERIARERRLFELGYALRRPRDLWRRLRFVIDQARAWSEAEGGTLRAYLEWAGLQASESARVAETVLPETDDDAVRISTIHGAKGLQFPITIVSGMTTASRGYHRRVDVVFGDTGPAALKVGSDVKTPEYQAHQPIDEQMGFHERLRLLYVACTRARDHLVVSLHRKARKGEPAAPVNRTNAELLIEACEDVPLEPLEPPAAAPAAPPAAEREPLPALEDWESERAATLADSGRFRSLGVSDVALLAGGADDAETVAGAAKQPRDLELPPWQKGRYGTAIGRAVHGTLQTIDLATGDGLVETAAAQAAAEGVIGREADIRRLVEDARGAPSVRQALDCPRWRETYVAAPVGDRTLEGYIDLLYRTASGLVIVDYKTASDAADLDARLATYRAQGGAYAVAVARATGEPVKRMVFLFLTPAGAVELDLPDLPAAMRDVRAWLGEPAGDLPLAGSGVYDAPVGARGASERWRR